MASIIPLAAGICLDVYIIARVILGTNAGAAVIAAVLLLVFVVFWRIVPQRARRRRSLQ